MNTLEAIFNRRSIRKFRSGLIPKDQLETVIRAAMFAPSAGNAQPWHFIVVDQEDILLKFAEINPNAAMAKQAGLAVVVCADIAAEKYPGYWPQDCAAAIQNLLLAVTEHGLGAVWTGIYPRQERVDKYREILSLPENIVPVAMVPIGLPAEDPDASDRYKPDKIHFNRW